MSITVTFAIADKSIRSRCKEILRPATGIALLESAESDPLIRQIEQTGPDLLILDLGSYPEDEITFQISLTISTSRKTRILLLTDGINYPLILDSLTAGARGYLSYNQLDTFLVRAVEKVHEGEAWIPRKMVSRLLDRLTETAVAKPSLASVK